MKKSVNTTTTKSNQELQIINDQDIFISNLIEGLTLTEMHKGQENQPITYQLDEVLRYLKKNPDLE